MFKLTPSGSTWTESVLYSFKGGSDGANPVAGLVFDASGYGTTYAGGTPGFGTVFKLTPSGSAWTESVLYSFKGGSDGANPVYGTLIFDTSGALYGTTSAGGSTVCSGGCGTVFKLTPSGSAWTESLLYSFAAGNDGAFPYAGLIFDASGALYGTTNAGGGGFGTVFKLSPSGSATWNETVLHTFGFTGDGGLPSAGLIFDASGALYGTTTADCFFVGCGSVFKLTPPTIQGGAWTESTLYSFTGGSDGAHPYAGLISDAAGALYGTTNGGGGTSSAGTVFELVQRPQLIYAKQADFNADGKGDILWCYIDGTIAEWLMHADGTFTPAGGQAIPNEWQIAGTGDFNGDGIADILWRCIDATSATCPDGQVAIWLMNANGSVNQSIVGPVIPTSWTIVGTGDFNGDGKTDILWRYIEGTVGIWFMNSGTISSTAEIHGVSTGWTIVGTGDFNHDGISDILWRCTTAVTFNPPCTDGTVGEWLMNSNGTVKQFAGGQVVSTGWTIVGTGDFNGDGISDILWRCTDATSVACTNGTVAIWMMNTDGTVKQFAGGQVVPTGWTIAGTGDFNGDGISDILWRCTDLASADCTNGAVGEWLMNPNGTVNQFVGGQGIPSSWAIID